MTTLYLVRHASTELLPHTICGRLPDIHLNDKGRREAELLTQTLGDLPVHKLFSSPLERARETAAPLAQQLGLKVEISEAFNELDLGNWTGRTFAELEFNEEWKQWNSFRSGSEIPGGENMLNAQTRIVHGITSLQRDFPNETLVVFSHGDPIRAALLYYLGMSLDFVHRIEISPAHVSVLAIDRWGAQVRGINMR